MLILLGILFLFVLIYSFRHPDFFYWLFLTFLFDPGGYLFAYFNKSQLSGFTYVDIFILLAFLPLLSNKVNVRDAFEDIEFRRIFYFLVFFAVYYIFIAGFIVPMHNLNYTLRYVIIREREAVFGFLLILPTYIFAKRNLKYFFYFIVITSVLTIVLFLLTTLGGMELIPIDLAERYKKTGIMRVGLYSYGFMELTITISLIVLYLKMRIKMKYLVFFAAIFTLLMLLLTLTKTYLLTQTLTIALTIFLIAIFFRISKKSIIIKFVLPLIILLGIVRITFPNYLDYGARGFSDIASLASGEKYSYGREEGRLRNLATHLDAIERYPVFGSGLKTTRHWNDQFRDYDVTDLPLTGHLMRFGFVGIAIYSIYYFFLIRIVFKLISFMRKNMFREFYEANKIELIFVIITLIYFIAKFLNFMNLYIELTTGGFAVAFYAGLMMAAAKRMENWLSDYRRMEREKQQQDEAPVTDEQIQSAGEI